MKIKAVNENVYGYPMEIEYNTKDFNGHQIGIAAFVVNNQTGEIDDNLTNKPIDIVKEMLNDESITFLKEVITQVDNGALVPKTVYSLPYIVAEHSSTKPTVNFVNTKNELGSTCYCELEILFVYEGLSRYITVKFASKGLTVLDMVDDIFVSGENKKAFLESIGIKYNDGEYTLDFYNKTGERTELTFPYMESLKGYVTSIRLIGCEHVKDGKI